MTDAFATVRQHVAHAEDQQLLDQLKGVMAQLARLALNSADLPSPEEREKLSKDLEAQKEQLEAQLSDRCDVFQVRMQSVTLEAVQAAMPGDAALLEFAICRPFDPRPSATPRAYGPPHYAAYVIREGQAPLGWDLGPPRRSTGRSRASGEALRDRTRKDLQSLARAVDDLVMRPLRASLGNATRLLVSPDGDLNLVPFDSPRRRARPLPDRTLRHELPDERPRPAASSGRA